VQHNIVDGLGEEDVTLLQSLAGQIAVSLQNARVYDRSRAQAELETMVNTIGQKIQRAGTVEETLQIAIREVGLALGAARVHAKIGLDTDTNPAEEASQN
jgi:GAF domain-containing protein